MRKTDQDTKRTEEYIIDESAELSIGELAWWSSNFFKAFPAFRHRNYTLYFSGQLVSMSGTWLQVVAQGWLVLQLTHSALWVGIISAISAFPVLVFTLFGGVIVDRFAKKKILLFTQSAALILSLIFGLLTVFNLINIWQIAVLVFLMGIVTALDIPARQSFVVEMVGKEDLSSAIALNASIFNSARVIGPSLAGFLIAFIGVGGAFIANALSYLAVLIALLYIHTQHALPRSHPNPLQSLKDGITYAFGHPAIRTLLLVITVLSVFGWSFSTMLPVVAKNVFSQNAEGLGYLFAASGLGAVCATIAFSVLSKKVSPLVFIIGGNFLFSLFLFLFTYSLTFPVALCMLFVAGFGLIAQTATINSTIQHMVDNRMRGRVMSIFTVMFIGMSPLGSLQIGLLAQQFGPLFAIRVGAFIVLCVGVFLFLRRNSIAAALSEHKLF